MKEKKYEYYDSMAVGKRIKEIRNSFNCTMEQFGRLIGNTTKAAVYNWEKGKRLPTDDSLELIAILGKTSVEWVVYGDLDEYISSLLTVGSKAYVDVKNVYVNFGHKELFEAYELASTKIQQLIVEKTIEKAKQNNWSYSDTYHIVDLFSEITDNILKRNRYAKNLPSNIKELLSTIEQQNLTDDELDSLLDSIRNYFEN
ncbi:helix-turn-helix transcriptional regulator [Enterococcus sp. BWT-B8]|uniref:helix-turn-helix domain-containing protein n=1 Tax=Enterococcus sp. BWT-B8 TaxID=2885157 RepID=UPI001E58EFC0|nr:helix-turn-helix transcriptional regulator [Enterococcus sp. BWT-B8]MCB5951266.1 helix-turn-helix transcriptional regulator [Enterococcus sp. BWT-B8]